jgi:hypothetical protein
MISSTSLSVFDWTSILCTQTILTIDEAWEERRTLCRHVVGQTGIRQSSLFRLGLQ